MKKLNSNENAESGSSKSYSENKVKKVFEPLIMKGPIRQNFVENVLDSNDLKGRKFLSSNRARLAEIFELFQGTPQYVVVSQTNAEDEPVNCLLGGLTREAIPVMIPTEATNEKAVAELRVANENCLCIDPVMYCVDCLDFLIFLKSITSQDVDFRLNFDGSLYKFWVVNGEESNKINSMLAGKNLTCIDGNHRTEAFMQSGNKYLPASIFSSSDLEFAGFLRLLADTRYDKGEILSRLTKEGFRFERFDSNPPLNMPHEISLYLSDSNFKVYHKDEILAPLAISEILLPKVIGIDPKDPRIKIIPLSAYEFLLNYPKEERRNIDNFKVRILHGEVPYHEIANITEKTVLPYKSFETKPKLPTGLFMFG